MGYKEYRERLTKMQSYKECVTEKDFQDFIFFKYVDHYNLICTCGEGIEINFNDASSHYQRCDYWKFCHSINRALEWSKLERSK